VPIKQRGGRDDTNVVFGLVRGDRGGMHRGGVGRSFRACLVGLFN
jgi:hypothetical protein